MINSQNHTIDDLPDQQLTDETPVINSSKKIKMCTTTTKIEHLPEEVITNILSRVPAKSVGRCRCVSKPWNFLSQPHFIKTHINNTQQSRNSTDYSLILVNKTTLYSAPLNNAHHLFDEITLYATELMVVDNFLNMCHCHGLILIVHGLEKMFTLINPTTKEFKQLPSIPYRYGIDVDNVSEAYGVGYDSISDDYKVVVICVDRNRVHNQKVINVYSVRNGTWKTTKSVLSYHFFIRGTFVGGCLHWIALNTLDCSYEILAFDLREEKFVQLPGLSSRIDFRYKSIDMLGGCLVVSELRYNYKVELWKLENYGVKDSCTKFLIINPDKVPIQRQCFVGEEQVVLRHQAVSDYKLVMHNLKDGTFKNIVVHGIPNRFYVRGSSRGSLVSPHCGNQVA